MKKIVNIKNLRKVFCKGNICVANDINLFINEGEIFTILGKSGSGKTTFLRMIAGLEIPDKGEIFIDEKEVFSKDTNLEPKDRGVAVVFQNYALLPHLSIASNITFGSNASKADLEEVLEKTKLKGQENKFPHELSGGQQQRVAVARAVVNQPKLILADEPTGNLDSSNGNEVMQLLTDLNEQGTTIIMVTHSEHDAKFSHRIIRMLDGQTVMENFLA